MKKTVTIEQKEFINASPEDVFNAYLDPKTHSAFTGAKATGAPKEGGKFTAWDGYIFGKFIKLEKGRRIVQEWMTSEWPEGYEPSLLDLTFVGNGEGTEIHMVHSKVPEEQAEEYRQGWIDYYWKPMKEYFENKKAKKK